MCFGLYHDMILFSKKFPFSLYATGIYVARNLGGCPACAASADVSVRKCHGTLQERGRLRVTDSQRLQLCGETLLIRLHQVYTEIIMSLIAFVGEQWRVSCLRIHRGCECVKVSRDTTRKRASESHGLSETSIVWRNTSDTFTPSLHRDHYEFNSFRW